MHVLLTRPEPLASTSAERLQEAGYEVINEPCQEVIAIEAMLQVSDGYIVTSQSGVEYGLKQVEDKLAVIFAVGEKTALAAEALGFEVIFAAEGDADSLIEVILSRWLPEHGRLVHLSGKEISTDICSVLTAIGYTAERAVVYDAAIRPKPSKTTLDAIKDGKIDVALFYSARAVTIFNGWIEDAGLEGSLGAIEALVMSERIADRLGKTWKKVKIASESHEDALLELLNREA